MEREKRDRKNEVKSLKKCKTVYGYEVCIAVELSTFFFIYSLHVLDIIFHERSICGFLLINAVDAIVVQ